MHIDSVPHRCTFRDGDSSQDLRHLRRIRNSDMQLLVFLLRLILGGLLVVTGALKVGHAPELASAIAGFRLLPGGVVAPMALVLPFFELLIGFYLVAGLFTRAVAWISVVQFVLYAVAIASAVIRGIPANCGCFGPNDQATADWPHVAFDLGLALIAYVIARFAPGILAVDRRLQRK
jgi:putative oxidoreductase